MHGRGATSGHALTKRQRFELLRADLKNERQSFEPHWKELAEFVLPRRARFITTETNDGRRMNKSIYDTTATLAANTLQSGMMSGITSPARPWFRVQTPDPDLNEFGRVREWLHTVSQRILTAFSRSNLYTTLPILYGDMGVFGTAAMLLEESFDRTVRFKAFPIGSYSLAADFEGRINVFVREFRMTVRNLVDQFAKNERDGKPDWSNFSTHVRNLYDTARYEEWVDVCHVIAPNPDYRPGSPDPKHKKFSSCYYEYSPTEGVQTQWDFAGHDVFLRESGYDRFPVLAPRWKVSAEDVYATDCPAMTALGDVRQLQIGEKRSLQAIEKMVNPPMQGPAALRNVRASILPGDITYYDPPQGREGLRPIHEVQPRIQELESKQAMVRERIQRAFYEDLFLMLTRSDRRQITAREIEERHEEKLLALGPVLEQLNTDLLDPLVESTFAIMLEQSKRADGSIGGMIPPIPEELQGMDLKIEYISVMAQAQKLVAIGSIERTAQFALSIAQAMPQVLDKIDGDQMIDEFGEAVGVSPRIIRTDEAVEKLRAGRAQAEQAQRQTEMIAQGSQTVKNLADSHLDGDTVLNRILDFAQAGQPVPQ